MDEGSLYFFEVFNLVLQRQGDVMWLYYGHVTRQHDLHLHIDWKKSRHIIGLLISIYTTQRDTTYSAPQSDIPGYSLHRVANHVIEPLLQPAEKYHVHYFLTVYIFTPSIMYERMYVCNVFCVFTIKSGTTRTWSMNSWGAVWPTIFFICSEMTPIHLEK